MNGPTPSMFDMFKAIAWRSPKRRSRGRPSFSFSVDAEFMWIWMKDAAHNNKIKIVSRDYSSGCDRMQTQQTKSEELNYETSKIIRNSGVHGRRYSRGSVSGPNSTFRVTACREDPC